jgi:hypothetical protein
MFDNAGGARHLLEDIAEVQRFARRRRLSNALLVSVISKRSRFAALGYRFRQIERRIRHGNAARSRDLIANGVVEIRFTGYDMRHRMRMFRIQIRIRSNVGLFP